MFRTAYTAKRAKNLIHFEHRLFFIGSCFSSNIYHYLTYRKFKALSNPHGILFNPLSVFEALTEIMHKKEYSENDLVHSNELFHSMQHHSQFSNTNSKQVVKDINKAIKQAHTFLLKTDYLFITFGSAWAYYYNEKCVGNCHKMPNNLFQKKLLSVEEIASSWQKLVDLLEAINPKIKVIFTLSPVRHLKDGFEENNLSKSILRTAIHEIVTQSNSVTYFPAYEIVMDDLRDYRFYKSDMLHPNDDAIEYVWKMFEATYFDEPTKETIAKIENLQKAMAHQPIFENTLAHKKHLQYINKEKINLKSLGFRFD